MSFFDQYDKTDLLLLLGVLLLGAILLWIAFGKV